MKLFEPGNIGKVTIKNRIAMAPMGMGRIAEPDGRWGDRVLEYYLARARGGTGLIITTLAPVETTLESMWKSHMDFHNPRHVESLGKVARAVHNQGAKIFVQLTAGFGRVISARNAAKIHPICASAVPCYFMPQITARELTTEEVEGLAAAFGLAARTARNAGVDGVELHGHEGYLLDQFQTALWNKRQDRYGGDLDGRLRLPLEAVAAIKREAGPDFPVVYRYGIDHHLDGGRRVPESLEIARRLEKAGVDALHVDAGCYETSYYPHPSTYQPPAFMVDMAVAVKKVVRIPVISVGKLWYPELAEKTLQEGSADFIALGRGLLSDPEWALKVRDGRTDDIRICIGDHDGCMGRLHAGKSTGCTINPQAGMETELALRPADKKKAVLVVGGGPAGMEAARVARLRGHEVTLWEMSSALGGNLLTAAAPDFKKDMRLYLEFQITQLRKGGVRIELNRKATVEAVKRVSPEAVILATGATPLVPAIPGISRPGVCTAVDLLRGKAKAGSRVLVVGAGLAGCETALYLAQKGSRVTILEETDAVLPDVFHGNKDHLRLLLSQWKVGIITGVRLREVTGKGAVVQGAGGEQVLEADSVVLASGMRSNKELETGLAGQLPELHTVGDCVEPRKIIDAVWQGFHAGRNV